jgi:hypothetical protein
MEKIRESKEDRKKRIEVAPRFTTKVVPSKKPEPDINRELLEEVDP